MRHDEVSTAEYTYTIILQPESGGGYTVTCPSLPGLTTYGETIEEARAMAAEAIEAYLESLRKDGEPIPESDASDAMPTAEPVRVKLELV